VGGYSVADLGGELQSSNNVLMLGALKNLDDLPEIHLDCIARKSLGCKIGPLKLRRAHAEVFIVLSLKHLFGAALGTLVAQFSKYAAHEIKNIYLESLRMWDRGAIMTEAERLEILDWACSIFFTMNYLSNRRLDYKLTVLDRTVPLGVWRIKKRLIEAERLGGFIQEPIFTDILTIIMPSGFIPGHQDPNMGEYIHTRFNVFLQEPVRGSKTYYGGELVDAKERHYTMCRSGLDQHWSEPIGGSVPRVTLSFGFLVPRATMIKMYKTPLKTEEESTPSALEEGIYFAYTMYSLFGIYSFYMKYPAKQLWKVINSW